MNRFRVSNHALGLVALQVWWLCVVSAGKDVELTLGGLHIVSWLSTLGWGAWMLVTVVIFATRYLSVWQHQAAGSVDIFMDKATRLDGQS